MTSETKRSVCRSLKFPLRRLTTNSFTGASCRTVGLISEIEVVNFTGPDPAVGEIINHGCDPSHAGGESLNGSNSILTGRSGHHNRAAAQAVSSTTRLHFQTGGRQKFCFLSSGFTPTSGTNPAAAPRCLFLLKLSERPRGQSRGSDTESRSWG